MSEQGNDNVERGAGWACASLDDLGEGPGFRKIRGPLGVTAFGVNAIVLPAGYATGSHFHDEQEELYFVHSGRVSIEFGDGTAQELGPGRPRLGRRPDPAPPPQPQRHRGGGLRDRRRQGRLRRPRRQTGRGRDPPLRPEVPPGS